METKKKSDSKISAQVIQVMNTNMDHRQRRAYATAINIAADQISFSTVVLAGSIDLILECIKKTQSSNPVELVIRSRDLSPVDEGQNAMRKLISLCLKAGYVIRLLNDDDTFMMVEDKREKVIA